MNWSLSQLASFCAGEVILGSTTPLDQRIHTLSTDSRELETIDSAENALPPLMFVALKGEMFDAHEFIPELLLPHARLQSSPGELKAILVDRTWWAKHGKVHATLSFLVVADTNRAYLALGKAHARHWRETDPQRKIIALTGSNGKTTTKEMIAAILRISFGETTVHATLGNLNNQVGLPKTLLGLAEHHHIAVIELGINHLGEMRELVADFTVDIALITNAGRAHLAGMGNVQTVAEEKGILFQAIRRKPTPGIAIVNMLDTHHDLWLSLAQGCTVRGFGSNIANALTLDNPTGMPLKINYRNEPLTIQLHFVGKQLAMNALAAIAVAECMECPAPAVKYALEHFTNAKGRLQLITHRRQPLLTVIDDTYNANPESMRMAIETLCQISQQGRGWLVLGDMAEIGEQALRAHQEIQSLAFLALRQRKILGIALLGVQHFSALKMHDRPSDGLFMANTHEEVVDWLVTQLSRQGINRMHVLVKGSRSIRMEKVVEGLLERRIDENDPHISSQDQSRSLTPIAR
jgi:UDP-N-acetylmuramoyl-tripeptide--D-alanyl-D-alanine ligase